MLLVYLKKRFRSQTESTSFKRILKALKCYNGICEASLHHTLQSSEVSSNAKYAINK